MDRMESQIAEWRAYVTKAPAVEDRDVHIRVADAGSWKTPPADPGNRGRGLLLMRTLSEQVDLDGTAHGTTVGMRFAVG